MKRDDQKASSLLTQAAARQFTRRTLLGSAAAGVALAAAGPYFIRNARASSGEVRIMTWSGYDFSKSVETFQNATGIKVTITDFPDQDKMVAQFKATNGEGFDLAEPTSDRVPNWVEQGLIQPLDETKANLAGVKDAFLAGAAAKDAVVDGKRYATPTVWGTEALAFDKAAAPLEYGTASYADLWKPEYAGKVTLRAHSGLVGIGLMLEAQGKLPAPMRESFTSEETMVKNYDVIIATAIAARKSVAQFWTDENSAQGAFRANGCVIGQNWDTSAGAMQKEGLNIGYVAPKEGALAWLQNWVVPAKAANLDQAYAWLSWFNSAQGSAYWAQSFSANPVAKGSDDEMPAESKAFLAASYPGDALEKLWWWPAQPTWFVTKRNEYADRFMSA
ncbi:extracellular solute-binding protein [Zavarzinia sp. CC-PAN008]|uniref:extracellular solute-binding protein n=1 Tax=Zavarzinia sp. CC-PAN008 TaxID=3243332 RepID=UPI003F74766B